MTRTRMDQDVSPRYLFFISTVLLLATAAACGGSSEEAASQTAATAVQRPSANDARPSANDARPRASDAVRGVVNAYIREQTTEGTPYYIESKAAEFEAFEDDVMRDDGAFICVARFISGTDVLHVAFHLKREMNAYVITQVVLRSVNSDSLQRTLYSRETLVL